MQTNRVVLILISLLVVSCGSAPTKQQALIDLSTAQIQQIQNYDELLALRQRLATALEGKDTQKYAADVARLAQIDSQLVEVKKRSLETTFAAARLSSGEVPLSVLEPAKNDLAKPNPLDKAKWASLVAMVDNELAKTTASTEKLSAALNNADASDADKIDTLGKLYLVTGADTWLDQKRSIIDSIIANIRKAREEGSFGNDIEAQLELVKKERPDDSVLMEELIFVSADIYKQKYFNALSDGNADEAYQILITMSESPDFPKMKQGLASSSQTMAEYFVALADESVKDPANLSRSYRLYSQASSVRKLLGVEAQIAGHTALVEQLNAKFEQFNKEEAHTMSLAYLYLIQEFAPGQSGLRKLLSDQESKVSQLAIKRLSTTSFEGSSQKQEYGDVISSSITQYLFQHIPNDVRIIEREQYEAIMRERKLGGDSGESLSAVDLLVTGSVLESKVDNTEAKGKKMIRVTVGKETIPNPGYISWLEMSAKDREGIEKPSDTIEVDKQENISVNITRHRKVGIFSVSYRLVDAKNGSVLFPDSITKEQEFSDDSTEGVEMGDFVMPFKLADLPSDVEILDKLAKKVATDIGERLVEKLQNQEQKYMASAEEGVETNNCYGEVDGLAKALAIMTRKRMETKELRERYKTRAVSCGGGA